MLYIRLTLKHLLNIEEDEQAMPGDYSPDAVGDA